MGCRLTDSHVLSEEINVLIPASKALDNLNQNLSDLFRGVDLFYGDLFHSLQVSHRLQASSRQIQG
jgi:hypothetical protein